MTLHVMDRQDAIDEVMYVSGVNWAPYSSDKDEEPMADARGKESLDMFERGVVHDGYFCRWD